jgi:hypothetical protein
MISRAGPCAGVVDVSTAALVFHDAVRTRPAHPMGLLSCAAELR